MKTATERSCQKFSAPRFLATQNSIESRNFAKALVLLPVDSGAAAKTPLQKILLPIILLYPFLKIPL